MSLFEFQLKIYSITELVGGADLDHKL